MQCDSNNNNNNRNTTEEKHEKKKRRKEKKLLLLNIRLLSHAKCMHMKLLKSVTVIQYMSISNSISAESYVYAMTIRKSAENVRKIGDSQ